MQKTKSGILLPDAAKAAVNEAKVVAIGEGLRTAVRVAACVLGIWRFFPPECGLSPLSFLQEGKTLPMAMEVGDVVILPEFGGAKLEMGGKEYFLYREQDILAKINKSA